MPRNSDILSDSTIAALSKASNLQLSTRSIMICGLYKSVGLYKPIRVPARLILTVASEKTSFDSNFLSISQSYALRDCKRSSFHFRCVLTALGFPNLHTFTWTMEQQQHMQNAKDNISKLREQRNAAEQHLRRLDASLAYEEDRFTYCNSIIQRLGYEDSPTLAPSQDHATSPQKPFSRMSMPAKELTLLFERLAAFQAGPTAVDIQKDLLIDSEREIRDLRHWDSNGLLQVPYMSHTVYTYVEIYVGGHSLVCRTPRCKLISYRHGYTTGRCWFRMCCSTACMI